MPVLKSFPPIANRRAKVLILGSMPGVRSLDAGEYYAHPQNKFWVIMASVLWQSQPLTYIQKKTMLLRHGVALWDVVRSCRRNGSLDADLREVQVNNFSRLLGKCPKIKTVFCNGQTAFQLFSRSYDGTGLTICCLPSTSPANTVSLGWKLSQWRKILNFI